ncbi:MAG: flagellar protein FlgN [Verrucomicrobiae bacterium]|nr:flagellar protein FlgN [Verrucomicrobiae bacterium]MDW8345203.1 flagellar protein FlgN [Verrucomicrobiae bacterium]
MNELVQQWINALREELTQYGGLLALLEQQREAIREHATDRLLENVGALNAQTAVVQVARHQRQQHQRALCGALGLAPDATVTETVQRLEPELRALVESLRDQINQCLSRAQETVRLNHLMLSRSVDWMQRMMASLLPASLGPTYGSDGRCADTASRPSAGLCEVRA